MSSGIYRIMCVPTGRLYIGSAISLQSRWRVHLHGLRQNKHHSITLQRAFNKYGESAFAFEVIELVLPPFLIAREQHYLDTLQPFGSKGFNTDRIAGSRYGSTVSPEAREKLRLANLGRKDSEETIRKRAESGKGRTHSKETRAKISTLKMGHTVSDEAREHMRAAQLGKKQSAEHLEKRRRALTGRSVSEETRAKIAASNVAGNEWRMKTLIVTSPGGETFTIHGVGQFCKQHGLNHSALIQVAKGRVSQHKGWTARYP